MPFRALQNGLESLSIRQNSCENPFFGPHKKPFCSPQSAVARWIFRPIVACRHRALGDGSVQVGVAICTARACDMYMSQVVICTCLRS